MDFFRKYFVHILLICVILVVVAMVIPYFGGSGDDNVSGYKPEQVKKEDSEIPFSHEGDLVVMGKDGNKKADFEIEFAKGEYETALGLMYRKYMEPNRGMLFIFPEEEPKSFWMQNTYISLDIIYINKNMEIVSISKNAEPLTETSRPSNYPAMYVLEVNGGICDKLGIKDGDKITYESLK